jgi:hypothetical protein
VLRQVKNKNERKKAVKNQIKKKFVELFFFPSRLPLALLIFLSSTGLMKKNLVMLW